MPHELETVNGTTFFADSREDAWHRLGQRVGRTMTAEEVMEFAHLGGWNVRKVPLQAQADPESRRNNISIAIPDRFATVRTNPLTGNVEYLGVVGKKYEPVQNEASTELLNRLVDESGARFETAGSLYGGRQTFVTMKLPESMKITGHNGFTDRTDWYLAALNSHDGSTAWRVLLTPIRIVCANTQAWAQQVARSSFSIRHTTNVQANIAEAQRILGIAYRSVGVIEEEFRRMSEFPCEFEEAKMRVEKLVQVDEAEPESTTARNRQKVAAKVLDLFQSSPTIQPIAGTRFALYNAVTEYVDHYAPVRSQINKADVRALRTIRDFELSSSLKARAFEDLRVAA